MSHNLTKFPTVNDFDADTYIITTHSISKKKKEMAVSRARYSSALFI